MEQKMAPGAGLTARQEQLLDLAVREPYFVNTFYLSGGTALSSWYLHHRESYDLDFFSRIPFDYEKIMRWFRQNELPIGYSNIRFDEDYGFLTVFLSYNKDTTLHIDFNHYSNTILSSGIKWHGLTIDSLLDITVNKIMTVSTHPRTRDYIDLFCIFKKKSEDVFSLIERTEQKFKQTIDLIQLAKNFLKVSEYTDYPRMLVPFDSNSMISFFESRAKQLQSRILI